jgi:nicotinamidase-related amidase
MPSGMALLIIDMQRDFLDPAGYIAKSGVDVTVLRAIIPQVVTGGSGSLDRFLDGLSGSA